jgi:hypothetical protein
METEILNTIVPLIQERTASAGTSHTFDLPVLIDNLKHSHEWENGELNSIIIIRRPEKQIVLTALHEGTEIDSYQSKDSITIQVIEGKLEFRTRKEFVILDKDKLLTLHENVTYSIISTEETVFLLTVTNNAFQQSDN